MYNLIDLNSSKTYINKENAIKAVLKVFPYIESTNIRFFIHQNGDGRYFPVFVGQQALSHGAHFHFMVVT